MEPRGRAWNRGGVSPADCVPLSESNTIPKHALASVFDC